VQWQQMSMKAEADLVSSRFIQLDKYALKDATSAKHLAY
jgi:hypothetical protein